MFRIVKQNKKKRNMTVRFEEEQLVRQSTIPLPLTLRPGQLGSLQSRTSRPRRQIRASCGGDPNSSRTART
ncbi:hypothetical protein CEXT_550931 [Caerostris extrusa]|uniref:Uncharacterized protein n=1 Tax=Caerostris extrusa TaxID=172846 RepID=A0AAV4U5X1_CAEEX|nr:hypothetical protein CEXT_550931 [Caerostris extrusa]